MSDFNPIADLSYRNYDGPLKPPAARWWTIARQTMRAVMRNKWLWAMSALAGAYYLVMIIFLFVMDRILESNPNAAGFQKAILGGIVWKEQFGHGIDFAQLPSMIIAIAVGAGAIANDNRANALLVYLSKPCTKFDYAFGKWLGIFLVLLGALAIPALAFYAYGALSFRELEFFKDPWLIAKLLATIPLCAALNASLILAVSSLFKQGRLAGAVYAGLYFLGDFFTKIMGAVWVLGARDAAGRDLVKGLFYASIDGLQIGLSRAILHTRGSNLLGLPATGRNFHLLPPPPPLIPMLLIVLAVAVVSIAIAWSRVRAVEVVG